MPKLIHHAPIHVDGQKVGMISSQVGDNATPEQRQAAFVSSIAGSETSYSRQEAYSEHYNQPSNNVNVKAHGAVGGDYGYFQMNEMDVEDALKHGMPLDVAMHLNGGGPGGKSSFEDQANAVLSYMKVKYPTAFSEFAKTGDYEAMRKAADHQWFGLSRHGGKPAREAYEDALNAMMHSGTTAWPSTKN